MGAVFFAVRKILADCEFETFITTNSKICQSDSAITLCTGSAPWSNRLREAVLKTAGDYVILLLDDFFFQDYVDSSEIKRILDIMESEKDIGAFYFKHSTGQNSSVSEYGNYIKMIPSKKYIINFQAGLWRKSALLDLIPPNMSAWDIEESITLEDDCKYRFYCPSSGNYISCKGDVFPYLWALQSGYGICKSKWLWNNKKLFKKENIKVHYDKLRVKSKLSYDLDTIKRRFKARLSTFLNYRKKEKQNESFHK